MPLDDILSRDSYMNPPVRRQGLVRQLMTRLSRFITERPASNIPHELKNTTETGASDALYASFSDKVWKIRHDRRSVYHDLEEMDLNDPLVATALDVIASCTTGFEETTVDGFDWIMESTNPKAMKLLEEMKSRLELGSEAWQIVRGFVRNGEEFREVVVEDDLIVRFKHLPAWTIMPNFDIFGNKVPGWTQRLEGSMPNMVIEFDEWQICPFVYGAKRGYFGTGLLIPARRTWRRLQKMEDGMAIARMTRAYDKIKHKVPVKPEWDSMRQQKQILQYKENMTRRKGMDSAGQMVSREKPLEVETDFFIPDDGSGKGDIEIMAAQNMQLMNIEDVQYHQSLLLSRLKVPRKMLNLGPGTAGALTDGGLMAEDIQFARDLRQNQAVFRAGMLRLASLALIFQGLDPDQLGVGVRMSKISTQDHVQNSKIALNYAQAVKYFAEVFGGMPIEIVAEKFLELSDEHKEIMEAFVKEKEAEKEAQHAEEMAFREKTMQIAAQKAQAGSRPQARAAPTVQEMSEAVTHLQMLVQRELEEGGQEFGVGFDERLALNAQRLGDLEAFVGA